MELSELYNLAEALDVEVDAFELEARDALSIQFDTNDYFIAIDPFRLTSTADEKTKLGHELGHCATGSFYNQYSKYDNVARNERRADKWAIRHLIPKEELDAAVADGHTEIYDLAEYFGVTDEFMQKVVHYYKFGSLA